MKNGGTTKQKILRLLEDGPHSPSDLHREIGVSLSVVHDHLRSLLQEKVIEKNGSPPNVYYTRRQKTAEDVVEDHFVFQDSIGRLHTGMDGFRLWSGQGLKNLPFEEKISLYAERLSSMESSRQDGVLDLTEKLQQVATVGESKHLDQLVCLFPRFMKDFGRTKTGVYMDIVKSVGDKETMEKLLRASVPSIIAYAKRKKVNAVGFVPPTRKRDQQIMQLVEDRFKKGPFRTAIIDIKKIRIGIPREQKTIRSLRDRMENANHTFQISPNAHVHNYKRILLVDDFIGSGTTLNQIAKMLKKKNFSGEVFGLGIVGEERGYSVEKSS